MSKIEGLAKQLPPLEIPFKIKSTGNVSYKNYEGDFVVHVPLVKDMSRIGIELAKLNDGVPHSDLDLGTALLHNAVAYLRVLLVESPDWFWKPDEMDFGMNTLDSNVAIDVFNEADEKVKAWKDALKPKEEKADEKPTRSKKQAG